MEMRDTIEGDHRLASGKAAAGVDGLLCDSEYDSDLTNFLVELGRSPAGQAATAPLDTWTSDSAFKPAYAAVKQEDPLSSLTPFRSEQDAVSLAGRKRQYCSTGDLGQLHIPSRRECTANPWGLSCYEDSDSRRSRMPVRMDAASIIPTSPNLQVQTTPMKRSRSTGVACTLMPFSLVKAFPCQEAMSLAEANKCIERFAYESPSTPQGSPGCLLPGNGRSPQPPLSVSNRSPRPKITVESIPNSLAEDMLHYGTVPLRSSK